jgi:hypothetical protein
MIMIMIMMIIFTIIILNISININHKSFSLSVSAPSCLSESDTSPVSHTAEPLTYIYTRGSAVFNQGTPLVQQEVFTHRHDRHQTSVSKAVARVIEVRLIISVPLARCALLLLLIFGIYDHYCYYYDNDDDADDDYHFKYKFKY